MNPIPEEAPPPLTPGYGLLLAVMVFLLHVSTVLILLGLGLPRGPAVYGMGVLVAYGAVFALCTSRIPRPPSVGLALVRPPRIAWWAVPALLWALLLSSEVDNVTKRALGVEPPDAGELPEPSLAVLVVVTCVVMPLAQEFLFRGALQPQMVATLGRRLGVAFTALLFALATGLASPPRLLPSLVDGLLLGVLREASGSLGPPLLLAVLMGATSVAASRGAFGIPGFDDAAAAHTPLGWLALAGAFTGVGLGLCRAAAAVRAGAHAGEPGDEGPGDPPVR